MLEIKGKSYIFSGGFSVVEENENDNLGTTIAFFRKRSDAELFAKERQKTVTIDGKPIPYEPEPA